MAVLILAHPSLSGMASGNGTAGNTAWSNSCRSRLYLETVKGENGEVTDDTLRRLTVKKANYAKTGTKIMLRWEHGRFVPTDRECKAATSNAESDRLFLDLLDQFTKEGRNVTAKQGPSYAPTQFAAHADAKGTTKQAFKAAMDRLLKAGTIKNITEGPPSKLRSKLVLKMESDADA